ncbi:ER membrane protein complex subunit 10 [Neltuma alba]|uniref:ER membrane protein complex subunit 10 n=1 Tax=Neltuma alba TaxID=207710 RepID=UPI0010A48290|nr:ER membrane protein complex subunit 10 [Prosopis alba]
MGIIQLILAFTGCLLLASSLAFESDELLIDDEEFGLEGGLGRPQSPPPTATTTSRKRFSESGSDSKIQFNLEHAFGDSQFSGAGDFSARLKIWNHGGQTLTKLRFSRNSFNKIEQKNFEKLLQEDDFYQIRLPSNVLSPPGRDYIISSVKARCLTGEGLEENFVIHMEGLSIVAVNYGAPGECPYPRQLRLPARWSFRSHTVLRNSEQAPRAPVFSEDVVGEDGEGEVAKPPERSFWAKYWMYLIPLGLIVMNAITQAMNMPEEQTVGQAGAETQRGTNSAVRRR